MTKTVRIEQYFDGFSVMVMDDDVKIADILISQENTAEELLEVFARLEGFARLDSDAEYEGVY